jgi:hypothetical protein
LITKEEASQPNQTPPRLSKTRRIGDPKIKIILPATNPIQSSPFPVKIAFSAADDAQIAVKSFKLIVWKVIPLDITDRVRRYVTPEGIDVPQAQVPAGNYNIQVNVSDTMGRTTKLQQN